MLGKDELDPEMVPEMVLLSESVLTHQYLWIDPATVKETLVYFVTTINCQEILAQGITVDHKLVWSGGDRCQS